MSCGRSPASCLIRTYHFNKSHPTQPASKGVLRRDESGLEDSKLERMQQTYAGKLQISAPLQLFRRTLTSSSACPLKPHEWADGNNLGAIPNFSRRTKAFHRPNIRSTFRKTLTKNSTFSAVSAALLVSYSNRASRRKEAIKTQDNICEVRVNNRRLESRVGDAIRSDKHEAA